MISAHSAADIRAAEQPLLDAGHGAELMRRAAHGLTMGVIATLRSRGRAAYGARVAILVGSGNNGGDALYAGAALANRGSRTTAILTGARTHPEALAAFRAAGGRCLELSNPRDEVSCREEAAASDVVIDGILGTGSRGGVREPAAGLVAWLERLVGPRRPLVVACDLPSGVDASTGEASGPVLRADLTVTFGAHKAGLLSAPGEQLAGTVRLVGLGLDGLLGAPELRRLDAADLAALLPEPATTDHKYTRGVAGIVAGSARYPGAALLAAAAASACGPGMVRYLGPESVAAALHLRNPELVCSRDVPETGRVQAWLLGPGIDGDDTQLRYAEQVLEQARADGLPTVVDAGALPLVQPSNDAGNSHLILTPHAGELSILLQRCGVARSRAEIEAAPLASARLAAEQLGAVVLVKGPTTVVAGPEGEVYTQSNGTARLATAGSGDTLGGILVALLAMGGDGIARTAALAAAVHGELARSTPEQPLNAGMLAGRIPAVWARLARP